MAYFLVSGVLARSVFSRWGELIVIENCIVISIRRHFKIILYHTPKYKCPSMGDFHAYRNFPLAVGLGRFFLGGAVCFGRLLAAFPGGLIFVG